MGVEIHLLCLNLLKDKSMIRKVKEGFRVVAESGRNMGTYPTREQAEKDLGKRYIKLI